ncbi:hypothetical protein RM543_05360 [Roseicyclus sp. F158]|uniref:Uncharacterized protein n=1 Tax=Tropicimonas omnivorans TaxID=3075590 RepID=A0ABU3DEF5_9RHOB|nr:hypothetical protein [Roseicyclus sp. F158]MDT0682103.1 hypothetical protein [Roseicyclus sp. F158]
MRVRDCATLVVLALAWLTIPAHAGGPSETTPAAEVKANTIATVVANPPPFGEMTKVCGVSGEALGTPVDKRPESGRTQFVLYDSAYGSSQPRSFFVTGLDGNCAIHVRATVAMFGSLELYEMMQFGGLGAPAGAPTDATYAQLRAARCGGSPAPCTGRKLDALARDTAFLSLYETQDSAQHLELLLHRGAVQAAALK